MGDFKRVSPVCIKANDCSRPFISVQYSDRSLRFWCCRLRERKEKATEVRTTALECKTWKHEDPCFHFWTVLVVIGSAPYVSGWLSIQRFTGTFDGVCCVYFWPRGSFWESVYAVAVRDWKCCTVWQQSIAILQPLNGATPTGTSTGSSVSAHLGPFCAYTFLEMLDIKYTPNAVVELLPHRHCIGATLIAP